MRLYIQIASVFAISIVMFGCNNATSPNGTTSTPVNPKQGTVYKTANERRDSTGMLKSSDTTISTVIASGLTIDGRTNVYQVAQARRSAFVIQRDTGALHLLSNGDVEVLGGNFGPAAKWLIYPFGSQTTTSFTQDTTVVGPNGSTNVHEVVTFTGAGTGNLSVKGTTYNTQKVTLSGTVSSGGVLVVTVSQTLAFAPGLGWIVTSDESATRNPFNGALGSSAHSQLYDFTLVQ